MEVEVPTMTSKTANLYATCGGWLMGVGGGGTILVWGINAAEPMREPWYGMLQTLTVVGFLVGVIVKLNVLTGANPAGSDELARRFDNLSGNVALAVGALAEQIQDHKRAAVEADDKLPANRVVAGLEELKKELTETILQAHADSFVNLASMGTIHPIRKQP